MSHLIQICSPYANHVDICSPFHISSVMSLKFTICVISFTYIHHVTYVHHMSPPFIIFHPCSPYVISSSDMFTICIANVMSGRHMFTMSPLIIKCHIMFTRCHLWLWYVHHLSVVFIICQTYTSYVISFLYVTYVHFKSTMFTMCHHSACVKILIICHTYPKLSISSLFEISSLCYLCTQIVISI